MPETTETLWTNTADGNGHSLVHADGALTLTVVKPDGTRAVMGPVATVSTVDELRAAFSGLGPKWNQVAGSETNVGGRYQAERRAVTPQEEVVWTVDHEKAVGAAQYEIRDRLEVVLRQTA